MRTIRRIDRGTAYERALLGYDRARPGQATDAQQMAVFCEDILPHHAPGLGPRLVWEGAQARDMATRDLEEMTRRRQWRKFDVLMFDDPPPRRQRPAGSLLTVVCGNELEAAQAAAELVAGDGPPELFAVRIKLGGRWRWLGGRDYVSARRYAQPGTREACDEVAAELARIEPGARVEVVPL